MSPHKEGGAMLEQLTWFKQAAFRWLDDERTIYIDPWGTPDDAPQADLIVITHAHHDHFCIEDIEKLSTPSTKLIAPHDVAAELSGDVTPVAPGESHEVGGLRFTTVPAYNTREEALHDERRRGGGTGARDAAAARGADALRVRDRRGAGRRGVR
jgi:L-ascorbate metabolism protein UlaG (beta-lactamase superfamily)